MWFSKPGSKRTPRKFRPTLERLEDRTVPTASWNNFGGNAQHTDVASVAAQPIDHLLWQVPLDLDPWGYTHYGDPIFTANNVVIVPIKVTWNANNQSMTNFIEVGINDVTGAVLWSTAPLGSIAGAANSGNTIVIQTNNTNGLASGDYVTIGGMQGDTAANTGSGNATYMVSNVTANSFTLDNVTGNGTYTGGGTWILSTAASTATSYIEPNYSWLPPNQAAYDPVTDRVYFPGPGGTIDYVSNPDTATGVVTPVQVAFYGTSNYTANESAYNASIYINTPLTVDSLGNVYFGYEVTGSNPSNITEGGIARISASGAATNVSVFAAADSAGQTPTDDGNWTAAIGSAPALSNDGSIVYFAVDDGGYALGGGEYDSYLVGLNSTTLAPTYSVHLLDPYGNSALVLDESSASPMVAPDGSIFMGVFGSYANGSRGVLLHYSGNLQTDYTPGAFGWDDTPSIIPTSMVPSYTGSSSYLILSKYNNYANTEVGEPGGGNGANEIAVLDPYASQPDPNNDPLVNGQPLSVMKQIMTFASPSPDIHNINNGDPDAVREWCTNGTAVDPADDSIFVNNEDGYTYEWNLGSNTITNTVEVSQGYGVPYTPTAISPNGEIFSDNGGTLFALGGYANYTINTVSSANPAVYGNSITLTTTLASTSGGATPTGTVTFTAYAGADNPLNYDETPIGLGTASVVNGVASLTLSGTALLAAHYHVTASYSGNSTYSAGQSTLVLPVLETATTSMSASANPAANGTSVTFTATVTPNGTPSTVVENGTGSSSYWVPTGTVTFMNGNTVLGTVTLNPLEDGTYASSYLQQVTFTTSSLPVGTDTITAVYSGDQNFAGGTSSVFQETVGGTTTNLSSSANPSIFGQSVTFTVTVSPLVGSNTPSGTVTFKDGSTTLGTATLSGGTATFSTSALIVGGHSITAVYGGDSNDNGSTSNTLTQTVNQDGTTTNLVSSLNPSALGQSVTFTATVTASTPGSGTPTGTVTFMDGSSTLGTGHVSGGVASFTTSNLSLGSHTITAVYGGDTNFTTSTSNQLTQVVNPGTLSFINSTPPASVASGTGFVVQLQYSQSSYTGQVALSVATGPGGIRGTTTASLVNGIATFSGVILDHFGNYTLTAKLVGGGSSVTSGNVSVTASTFRLISSAVAVAMMPTTVQFAAVDDLGNTCTTFNGPVNVSLISIPFRGQVRGNLTPTVTNGIITLTNLTFTTPGSYVFGLSCGSITGTATVVVPGSIAHT